MQTRRPPFAFYLPEDPDYTIVDSALDSARFAVAVCREGLDGGLMANAIEHEPDGTPVRFRGRLLEGCGYLGDAVFASHWLSRLGDVLGDDRLMTAGDGLGRHVMHRGFFDQPGVPIVLYRDTETGEWLHNLEGRPEYVELGHVCRVAIELLGLADLEPEPEIKARMLDIATATAAWAAASERCPNGWYPRRCTPEGRVYSLAPDAYSFQAVLPDDFPPDPYYDRSGCGSLVLRLLAEVTGRGLGDYRDEIRRAAGVFVAAGGMFASTNTDTEDPGENVSYAVGYLALARASDVLADAALYRWALDNCLRPLEQFEMREDVNGLATKGLLWMDRAWTTASMWEMATASVAYLDAFGRLGERRLVAKTLTILRAKAKHHHGPLGMLTEAVDWDGRFPPYRHFPGQRWSDVSTTHTFMNNTFLLEPTVLYLERFAHRLPEDGGGFGFYDFEGNRIASAPPVSEE